MLSLLSKFTDSLGHSDKNRQREHVHHRNLWSGITAILRMSVGFLYLSLKATPFEGERFLITKKIKKNVETPNC